MNLMDILNDINESSFDKRFHKNSVPVSSDFKKGDKVRTRDGDIETVVRVNSNGNIETEENDYTWPPYTLTVVERPKRTKRRKK